MTSVGITRRPTSFSTPLPPCASFSSGGHCPASSTSSWSRNGTRASSPNPIVMLSTRFTGSSTSMTWVSSRSAASIGVSAPGRAKCRSTNSRETSRPTCHWGFSTAAISACERSKNASMYVDTAVADPGAAPRSAAIGGYQW